MNQITEQEQSLGSLSPIKVQEQQANKYACQILKSHKTKPEGEELTFGTQSFWQETVLNYLKDKALIFIGQTLKQLAINHLVDFAEWLLGQLESYLLTKYQAASEEEKAVFKKKIEEKFPNSSLAQKL